MDGFEAYVLANTRPASILQVGGFRPTGNPQTSHFGLTPLGLRTETWPRNAEGKPLEFICQLNLKEAPYVPAELKLFQLVTVFIDEGNNFIAKDFPVDSWCVRAYEDIDALVPMNIPRDAPKYWLHTNRGFEGIWREVADQPVYDDEGIVIPEGFDIQAYEAVHDDIHLDNISGTKLGGYASNIQNGMLFSQMEKDENDVWHDRLQDKVKYVFQIDCEPKVGLNWVDSGVVYFGLGIASENRGQWYVSCQFY
jgi:hypothetical protein